VLVFSDFESAHLWRVDLEATGLEYVRTAIWHKNNGAPQFTGDCPAVPGEAVIICYPHRRKRWNGGGHQAWWPADFEPGEVLLFRAQRRSRPPSRTVASSACISAQKPLSLMRELVRLFSDPNELIVDSFAGSSSSCNRAVASCMDSGRFDV
jgi:DNA modification methylase